MKTRTKIISTLVSSVIFTSTVLAFENSSNLQLTNANDYTIKFFKDCQLVSEKALTQTQLNNYLELQKTEQQMRIVEAPIKEIEQKMHEHSAEVERLSALAIVENEESLHINKKLQSNRRLQLPS